MVFPDYLVPFCRDIYILLCLSNSTGSFLLLWRISSFGPCSASKMGLLDYADTGVLFLCILCISSYHEGKDRKQDIRVYGDNYFGILPDSRIVCRIVWVFILRPCTEFVLHKECCSFGSCGSGIVHSISPFITEIA